MSLRKLLITGGSGKFGRVMLEHFLSRGDQVVTTCANPASIEQLLDELKVFSDRLVVLQSDLTAPEAPEKLIAELDRLSFKPECLINNARSTKFLQSEEDGTVSRVNFSNEFLLDVIVPYELTMALVKQNGSQLRNVVNIGSMYGGVAVNPNLYADPKLQAPPHYGVAKAGLAQLTKELAVRLAQKKIRVNCIAYGGVEGRVDEEFQERYAKLCPQGRMLQEHEIPGPVEMMLSDQSSGVTGHVLVVDGGWSIW